MSIPGRAPRLLLAGAEDVADIVMGPLTGSGRDANSNLAASLSGPGNTPLEIQVIDGSVAELAATEIDGDILVVGVAERDPATLEDDLRQLVEQARADDVALVAVLGSTYTPPGPAGEGVRPSTTTPARVAAANLAALRVSDAVGLAFVDADRILGEIGASTTVAGLLHYSPAGCAALRHELARVLVEMGAIPRPAVSRSMLPVPFVAPGVRQVTIRRWLAEPGTGFAAGDELCELTVQETAAIEGRVDAAVLVGLRPAPTVGTGVRPVNLRATIRARAAGRLARPLVAEGATVDVGSALAEITNEDDLVKGTEPGAGDQAIALPTFPAIVELGAERTESGDPVEPPEPRSTRTVTRLLRRVTGPDSVIERRARTWRRQIESDRSVRGVVGGLPARAGRRFLIVGPEGGERSGVFFKGGCDLPVLFMAAAELQAQLGGEVCLLSEGVGISDSRADILLQTLDGVPESAAEDIAYIRVRPSYFEPRLFEPTFAVPGLADAGSFPKTIVALSVAPNMVRTAYRHRQHGYLVDPGGWWLNDAMDTVLKSREKAVWFAKTFKSVGRMSVEQFRTDFALVVREVRARTGATVVAFNQLVFDPHDATYDFRDSKSPATLRRRAFAVALHELAEEEGFVIVDADRALKGAGVSGIVDFAHYGHDMQRAVAAEAVRSIRAISVRR